MRGAISMRMIGQELIQNNNIIYVFLRKLNYLIGQHKLIT